MAWMTQQEAAVYWRDAARLDAGLVSDLLDAAESAVLAYAPTPAPDPIPARWKIAAAYHARDTWLAASRDADAISLGDAAYPIRVRPLSSTVRQLLRPTDPRPRFGGAQ